MLNKTIEGIVKALTDTFQEDYRIYINNREEGVETPCFYIKVLNPSQTQKLGNQYERLQPFDIHYFPNNMDDISECLDMIEKLFDILEYITVVDDLVRGTKMSAEIKDGVLHFYINYDMLIIKNQTVETMGEIHSDVDVKKG